MAWIEIKVNLDRAATALERIAVALESLAPKTVERPLEKAKPRGAVRIINDRQIWQRQETVKILRARGYSPKMIAETLERLKSEEKEEVFPQQSESPKTAADR